MAYNKEDFIKYCNQKYKNKYTYNLPFKFSSRDKIEIICPIHGGFFQIAANHKFGTECKQCSIKNDRIAKLNKLKNSLIQEFNEAHRFKYKYNNDQIMNLDKITNFIDIKCPYHGLFKQRANRHRVHGCKKCANDLKSKVNTHSISQWIAKANKKHNYFYTYNVSSYTSTSDKIIVTCPNHGEFTTDWKHHIYDGAKCPRCPNLRCGGYSYAYFDAKPSKKSMAGVLYFLKFSNQDEEFYKIGVTYRKLKHRIKEFSSKYDIEILMCTGGTLFDVFVLEQKILSLLTLTHYLPINKFHGSKTECFIASNEDIKNIISLGSHILLPI